MADEMNKLLGTTPDLTELNTEKVKELFPQAVTEGKIDFDTLKSLLGDDVDDTHEKYQFTWHGKSKAIKLAQSPSSTTLRPSKDDSKNWDTTENLYIEGDNLEVLKQLQKTYFGKTKMIYIDPPYNTGGDFVYKDNFKDTIKNYKEQTNQAHKANAETSGRYHTDWLNMMYPRLMLAKNLLSDDGVIFISIDDNEQSNLKKMCDEIFGDSNLIGQFIWRGGRRNAAKTISVSHEYMLGYAKSLSYCMDKNILWRQKKEGLKDIYKVTKEFSKKCKNDYLAASKMLQDWYKKLSDDNPSKLHKHYSNIDARGVYFPSDISRGGGGGPKWEIKNPYTSEYVQTPARGWAYSKIEDLNEDISNDMIHFNGKNVPCKKRYLRDNEETLIETVFYKDRRGSSKRLRKLLNGNIFDFPKDENIIQAKIEQFLSDSNGIILDFFSGSATTAHAIMKLNAEDGGNRKFIMVQLPELTDEKSEAHKAGYENICEIGKERIRRAGKQIQEDMTKDGKDPSGLDVGFKVFKLDSTNIKEWDSSQTLNEQTLLDYDNIFKDGRTQEDVLYEILLKYGVFNMPVKEIQLNDKTAYDVAEGNTLICLANDINEEDIQAIGKLKPQNVIFKESGFKDDNVKLNAIYTLEKQGVEDIQAI